MTQSDGRRFVGAALLFAGRLFLFLSFFFFATWQGLGFPTTTTPLRLIFFALLGLVAGSLGCLLASGVWTNVWQLPLEAAATAGLLFLLLLGARELQGRHPPLPAGWLLGLAAVAPLSWWLAAPSRRRRSRARHLSQEDVEPED